MDLALDGGKAVRLSFPAYGDHWRMIAPYSAIGSDFLNNIAYQTPNHLPGSITNVTWSAKFYGQGRSPDQMAVGRRSLHQAFEPICCA